MANLQGGGYKMDIVFVIDSTGSMDPIISQVKACAKTFGDQVKDEMAKAGKAVDEDNYRLAIVDFADYATEGADAIRPTPFFKMPEDRQAFCDAVDAISIVNDEGRGRGGDLPENALEALYVAMNYDWVDIGPGENGRHMIVLLTDALPLFLQERAGLPDYPEDFPPDVEELLEVWHPADSNDSGSTKLHKAKKRLVLYAPEGTDAKGHTWDDVRGWPRLAGGGVVEPGKGVNIDLNDIIAEIVRSA